MHIVTLCILVVVLVAYVALGGVGFHYLESDNEENTRVEITRTNRDFLANFSCVSEEQFYDMVQAIITAYDSGVLVKRNSSSESNWDIYSSIFFSSTVVTTIGYGHISPGTSMGRLFCAIFALFGIPLFLVVTSGLATAYKGWMRKWFNCLTCKQQRDISKCRKITTAIFIALFNICLYFVVPAVIFTVVEPTWSYETSFYYCFITLTTIGFGDYVAGVDTDNSYRGIYRILIAIWIVLGLMWLGSVFSQIQERFEKNIEKKEMKKGEQNKMILKTPPPGRLRSKSNGGHNQLDYNMDNHNFNHIDSYNNIENGGRPTNVGGGLDNPALSMSTQL